MSIGKIIQSNSHIAYIGQLYGAYEAETDVSPRMPIFGQFVRVALRSQEQFMGGRAPTTQHSAVGIIYGTHLLNPFLLREGPRLSSEKQTEVFSPDSISEKVRVIFILLLGTVEHTITAGRRGKIISVMQGVPFFSLESGNEIEMMDNEEVQAFHCFGDPTTTDTSDLRMEYVSTLLTQHHRLMPMVTVQIIDELERLFPDQSSALVIIKRNITWRLMIESTR